MQICGFTHDPNARYRAIAHRRRVGIERESRLLVAVHALELRHKLLGLLPVLSILFVFAGD